MNALLPAQFRNFHCEKPESLSPLLPLLLLLLLRIHGGESRDLARKTMRQDEEEQVGSSSMVVASPLLPRQIHPANERCDGTPTTCIWNVFNFQCF